MNSQGVEIRSRWLTAPVSPASRDAVATDLASLGALGFHLVGSALGLHLPRNVPSLASWEDCSSRCLRDHQAIAILTIQCEDGRCPPSRCCTASRRLCPSPTVRRPESGYSACFRRGRASVHSRGTALARRCLHRAGAVLVLHIRGDAESLLSRGSPCRAVEAVGR